MGFESFPARVEDATKAVGAENILPPAAAKEFMNSNKDTVLVLDVQDPGNDSVPGAYNASLGTLLFKADAGMTDFKDPKIADLPKDNPIIVTCALGGQALLGAQILVDYGFKNVKTIEGGCIAFKKHEN
jgi:rhodanese-related sulfurtransferase